MVQGLARARNLLDQGFYEQSVEKAASVLEQVMREALATPSLLNLTADEYFSLAPKIGEKVTQTGKTVKNLGLGELIGVYREAGLFPVVARKESARLKEFQADRLKLVNDRRVGSIHHGGSRTKMEAEQGLIIVESALLEIGYLHEDDVSSLREKRSAPIAPMTVSNLPQPPFVTFVGRNDSIEAIEGLFASENPKLWAVQLTGEGGIGKTALAYFLAERMFSSGRFQAVIWFSGKLTRLTSGGIEQLRATPPGISELCTAVLDAFGEPIRPVKQDFEWVRRRAASHLAAQPTLIIVDNWETIQDPEVTNFLEGLPPSVRLLSTTRIKVGGHKVVEIMGLSIAECKTLALSLLGSESRAGKTLVSVQAVAQELQEVTSGNPLAVSLVCAWISEGLDLVAALRKIGRHRSGLHDFLYQELYAQLDVVSQDLLYTLASVERPLTKPELAHVLERDPESIENAIHRLLKFSMILDRSNLQEPDDRFRVAYVARQLAAAFALRRLDHDKELRARISRFKTRAEALRSGTSDDPEFIAGRLLRSDSDRLLASQCSEASRKGDLEAIRNAVREAPGGWIPLAFLVREYARQGRADEVSAEILTLSTLAIDAQAGVLELLWELVRSGNAPPAALHNLAQAARLASLDLITLHKAATYLGKSGLFALADGAHQLGAERSHAAQNTRQLSFFYVGRVENTLQWVWSDGFRELTPEVSKDKLRAAERLLDEAEKIGQTAPSIIANKRHRLAELLHRVEFRSTARTLPVQGDGAPSKSPQRDFARDR